MTLFLVKIRNANAPAAISLLTKCNSVWKGIAGWMESTLISSAECPSCIFTLNHQQELECECRVMTAPPWLPKVPNKSRGLEQHLGTRRKHLMCDSVTPCLTTRISSWQQHFAIYYSARFSLCRSDFKSLGSCHGSMVPCEMCDWALCNSHGYVVTCVTVCFSFHLSFVLRCKFASFATALLPVGNLATVLLPVALWTVLIESCYQSLAITSLPAFAVIRYQLILSLLTDFATSRPGCCPNNSVLPAVTFIQSSDLSGSPSRFFFIAHTRRFSLSQRGPICTARCGLSAHGALGDMQLCGFVDGYPSAATVDLLVIPIRKASWLCYLQFSWLSFNSTPTGMLPLQTTLYLKGGRGPGGIIRCMLGSNTDVKIALTNGDAARLHRFYTTQYISKTDKYTGSLQDIVFHVLRALEHREQTSDTRRTSALGTAEKQQSCTSSSNEACTDTLLRAKRILTAICNSLGTYNQLTIDIHSNCTFLLRSTDDAVHLNSTIVDYFYRPTALQASCSYYSYICKYFSLPTKLVHAEDNSAMQYQQQHPNYNTWCVLTRTTEVVPRIYVKGIPSHRTNYHDWCVLVMMLLIPWDQRHTDGNWETHYRDWCSETTSTLEHSVHDRLLTLQETRSKAQKQYEEQQTGFVHANEASIDANKAFEETEFSMGSVAELREGLIDWSFLLHQSDELQDMHLQDTNDSSVADDFIGEACHLIQEFCGQTTTNAETDSTLAATNTTAVYDVSSSPFLIRNEPPSTIAKLRATMKDANEAAAQRLLQHAATAAVLHVPHTLTDVSLRYLQLLQDIVDQYTLTVEHTMPVALFLQQQFLRATYPSNTVPQLLALLTGGPGTGKSRVILALRTAYGKLGIPHKIIVTASTGVVATNLQGFTTHSACKIRRKDTHTITANSQIDWTDIDLAVHDEISMICANVFQQMNTNIQVYSGTNNPTLPFGGIDQLFTGDFQQYTIEELNKSAKHSIVAANQNGIPATSHTQVFDRSFCVPNGDRFNDASYSAFISRLCSATVTDDDRRRLVTRVISTHLRPPVDSTFIVLRNDERHRLNLLLTGQRIQSVRTANSHASAFLLTSEDIVTSDRKAQELPCSVLQELKSMAAGSQTEGLAGLLLLAPQQQYILTKNLYTQLNIVNGGRCTLRSIHYTTKATQRCTPALMTAIQHIQLQMKLQNYTLLPTMPDYITVCISTNTSATDATRRAALPPSAPETAFGTEDMVIFPENSTFRYAHYAVHRRQTPIDHSIVLTNHKAQGQTLGSTVVGAGPVGGMARSSLPAELRVELARQNTLAENTATLVQATHVFNASITLLHMVTAMTSHTVPDCRAILGTLENTTFAAIPSRDATSSSAIHNSAQRDNQTSPVLHNTIIPPLRVDPACSSEQLINSLPVNSSISYEFDERLYVQQYECLFHKDMPYMHSQQQTLYSIGSVTTCGDGRGLLTASLAPSPLPSGTPPEGKEPTPTVTQPPVWQPQLVAGKSSASRT
ncbi:hypothetical protein Pelo_8457 [Pelomyxa schiedti]|nr:hypothetical protein Pelo_8457 [Pelomyxa schiedti]